MSMDPELKSLRWRSPKTEDQAENLIEGFIDTVVTDRRLDERTVKAYRLDLELFFRWLGTQKDDDWKVEHDGDLRTVKSGLETRCEERQEAGEREKGKGEKKKEIVPIYRSGKGIHGGLMLAGGLSGVLPETEGKWEEKMEEYLEYLFRKKGLRFSTVRRKYQVLSHYLPYLKSQGIIRDFRPVKLPEEPEKTVGDTILTKQEVDSFFQAIAKEYAKLDSDFRRRVCVRDQVMMGLLFYHRVEVSELLRMEVPDYDRKTATLRVRRKREKVQTVYLYSHGLQRQMNQWLDEHEYFEHWNMYHNRMFLSKLGKPLSMKMVTNIFDKYRVLAGIQKECTPKDLMNSLGRYGEELVRELG